MLTVKIIDQGNKDVMSIMKWRDGTRLTKRRYDMIRAELQFQCELSSDYSVTGVIYSDNIMVSMVMLDGSFECVWNNTNDLYCITRVFGKHEEVA